MINLKEIEKAIDELLASETEASLKSWLKEQELHNRYLGEGEFLLSGFKNQHIEIATTTRTDYISNNQEDEFVDSAYAMAA